MSETMGQIIKRLRKERNFTQEELAEQLGVTCQAVSKWENDSGLPDISQVVPLSVVFGVSTDVLFGRYNANDEATIDDIIKEAKVPLKTDNNNYSEVDCYNVLTDAFGIVAIAAAVPVVLVQLVGLIYSFKLKNRKEDISSNEIEEIIELDWVWANE